MRKYLHKVLEDILEVLRRMSSTLVADHLFQVRGEKETEFLEEYWAEMFHHSVSQLLLLISRSRRHIQTAILFLTTRVKRLDKYNWGNLKIVLKYPKGTKHMKLILRVDSLSVVNWWIYAS